MSISFPAEKVKSIQVSEYLKNGFELYKNNIVTLIVGLIIVLTLSIVSIGILAGSMICGYMRICSKLAKPIPGEEAPKPTDVFDGFDVFLPSFLVIILTIVFSLLASYILGFFGTLGTIVHQVISFILGGSLAIGAYPLIAFKKTESPVEAILTSIEILKASPQQIAITTIVTSILGYVGALAFGIGIIVTIPFTFCVYALIFNDLFRSEETPNI